MISISTTEISQLLGIGWWPLVRVSGFFLMAPIFGDRIIPLRIRLGIAFLISLTIAPLHAGNSPAFDPFKFETALLTANELFIGFCLGLSFNLLLSVFTQAGQIISMQMGLAMAVMNDPHNGVSASVISRIFMITTSLIFLTMDGHILMTYILKESFIAWPIHQLITVDKINNLLSLFGWFFSQSLLLAIPSVAIMLSTNITFGLLSKLAPSLNIFALGFPFTILMGLVAFFLSLFNIGDALTNMSYDFNIFFDEQFRQ